MALRRHLVTILLATSLLTTALVVLPTGPSGYCAAETDEVTELREELNATRAKLTDVEKERDDYSQELQDQTVVLIIALILLIASWIVFFLAAKRQRIALMELEKRVGVDILPRPRRRRRG